MGHTSWHTLNPTMAIEKYTIIVNGERFVFTRDQLESDPGNYFWQYFLGGFKEVPYGTTEMEVEKEPLFFKLIQAHLRGYEILPLPDQCIPPYMTKEGALRNLSSEAEFYGLWDLHKKIETYRTTTEANLAKAASLQRKSKKKYKLAVSNLRSNMTSSADITLFISNTSNLDGQIAIYPKAGSMLSFSALFLPRSFNYWLQLA